MTPGFLVLVLTPGIWVGGVFFLWGYLLGFFLSSITYFQWCDFSQTVSIRNMIQCVIYYILRDVLWTSFPVWEEGQAGCGDVLEALAVVSVSRFGSVSRQCMWGRACAFWSSCPPSPYRFILTSLIKDITSPCKTCLSCILGHLQMQQEQRGAVGYAVLEDHICLFSFIKYLGFTVVLEMIVGWCAFSETERDAFLSTLRGSCNSIVPWICNTGLNILMWYFKIHPKNPNKNVCISCETQHHEWERGESLG